MNEFELINTYFMHSKANGDDAAIVPLPTKKALLTCIDTLLAGRHFLPTANPFDIGFKSLAVSISDMAAMGASPSAFLLSLTLPSIDESWLSEFSQGLYSIAQQFNMEHLGGDMTRGPLVVSCVVFGEVPEDHVLTRSGAHVDDDIYVSGMLGEAGAALHDPHYNQSRLNRPLPRVELGIALRDIATSCIDISDGLAQDLQHILEASNVGATLVAAHIPQQSSLELALSAGDDYELCFSAPKNCREQIAALAKQLKLPLNRIGAITKNHGLTILGNQGNPLDLKLSGYQHF